ncbi:MAG: carboxypeptidase regulatory-like domain-containing protein [Acidobacteriota bacterium]
MRNLFAGFRVVFFAGVLAVVLSGAGEVMAQTIYGSISGTVLDQSGGTIPGAEIVVKNLETGIARNTVTDEAGFYRVTALASGEYSVQATMPSFEIVLQQPIPVRSAVEATVDFKLKPSGGREVVTVEARAAFIETTRSQLNKIADFNQIKNLPGRDGLNAFALLQPGVVNNQNGRPGSGFVVNGARSRSNNFTIDGANNNDQSLSIPRTTLVREAIQEVNIVTNNFSAEYGRNSGSYVNVITKSGTNDLHGTVQYQWNGNSFDAFTTNQERTFKSWRDSGLSNKDAMRKARGVVVDSMGGFTVGGPVKRDHTHFFTAVDKDWYRTTAVPAPTRAISAQGLQNLQAVSSEFAPGALDFLTKTFPVANDVTPRGTIKFTTPSGKSVDVPLQQFNRAAQGAFPYGRGFTRYLQKIDTKLGENDNLSARYLIYSYNDPGSPTAIPGQEIGQVQRDQSFTLNEAHIFGPRTTNEFRFTYSRRKIDFPEDLDAAINITGFNSVGNQNYPQYRTDNVFEYMDNISHLMLNHSLKAGVNILRYQLNSFFAPNTMGLIIYPSLPDLLFDRNASFSQYAGTGYVPARTTELGTFIQDDWRVKPTLTVNMGLRWEYTGVPFGFFSNATPDKNNWAPRLGLAWKGGEAPVFKYLLGSEGVLRAGYAISYDQVFQNILLNTARNYPRGVSVSIDNISGQRLYDKASRPAPPKPEDYKGNVDLLPVRLFSPNDAVTQPYAQQFTLGIERPIVSDYAVRVYYIATRGVHLVREVESNIGFTKKAVDTNPATYQEILPQLKPVTNASGVVTGYRMDPTKGSILVSDGRASSSYHSGQITLDKRFSHGLQFQANYTYSAFINDSDDILGGQANRTLPAYPFNIRLDRGRSAFDQPHRFVANWVYQFPQLLADTRVVNNIVGGWQISGVYTLASGTPYTIFSGGNALGILPGQITTVNLSQRVSINPNGEYPKPTSAKVTNPYFVYNVPDSGIIGNLGANTERTGGTNTFDVALQKDIRTLKIGDQQQKLEVRWELFNVFNHRNFTTIPANTVNNATDVDVFMNLGRTNVGGRGMLFIMRYVF